MKSVAIWAGFILTMLFVVTLSLTSVVKADSENINAENIMGYMWRQDTFYPPMSENKFLGSGASLGQTWDGGTYFYQFRAFFSFDTENIPDDAIIENATLYLALYADYSDIDFDVYFYSGENQWMDESDLSWDDCSDNQGIFFNTSDKTTNTYYSQTVTPSAINKTGRTQFRLTSAREEASIEPIGVEGIEIYGFRDELKPYLEITYILSSEYNRPIEQSFTVNASISRSAEIYTPPSNPDNVWRIPVPNGENRSFWELTFGAYTGLIGPLFWAIMVGLFSGLVWIKTQHTGPALAFMLIASAVLAAVLEGTGSLIMGLFAVLAFVGIAFRALVH